MTTAMTPSCPSLLVNPWAVVTGVAAPGSPPAPPGIAAGVAGSVVIACAYLVSPAATTSTPVVARAATAPPEHDGDAVHAMRPPPRRIGTRPAGVPRPVERPARVPHSAPEAGRAVRMLGGRVTSGFGRRDGSMHWGLDLAAPIGTPIRVPLGGTVISAGPARGFGRWVRVRHADGTVTVYGHVNRALVAVGERVRAGDVIAEVGNRGQSTGPHLHIEVVQPGGRKVDPRPWLDAHGIGYRAR